jgi:hypothetical protein
MAGQQAAFCRGHGTLVQLTGAMAAGENERARGRRRASTRAPTRVQSICTRREALPIVCRLFPARFPVDIASTPASYTVVRAVHCVSITTHRVTSRMPVVYGFAVLRP